MSNRAEDFARHGTNVVEQPVVGIRIKPGLGAKLLILPRFRDMGVEECILRARKLTRNRIPCKDKSTAIALILGVEGKRV